MREKPQQKMRIWAMFCHFSALLAWILLFSLVFIGIPFYLPLNILLPLIIWQFNKAKSPWIDFQGKEALNFQLSLTFYTLIIIIISLLVMLFICAIAVTNKRAGDEMKMVLDGLISVWFLITTIMLLLQLFLVNFAAFKAYHGDYYRYPLTIRVLR
ncbi:DUF4870 domain-containing protein [Calothrix sp. PCC 7507]|uniref:DUF4870 domain-containing protein n=1 Tax=Calothrix sp. PCC 7507 TaxID=99598 RepID=UPI00029EE3C5|nr:DUF4870 domain-containing protein [Calothrix sp. PCC 7507]AFY31523.1 hypothetical protein Cal7507_1047 [Calothrix sp. PCC 7507]